MVLTLRRPRGRTTGAPWADHVRTTGAPRAGPPRAHHGRTTGGRATGGPLELAAAQNEYEPMLVVLQPGGRQPYDGVSVAVPGTAIASQASRVGYVSVVNITDCDSLGPGEYPDPLVPDVDSYLGQKRNAFPVSVPAGQHRLLLDALLR